MRYLLHPIATLLGWRTDYHIIYFIKAPTGMELGSCSVSIAPWLSTAGVAGMLKRVAQIEKCHADSVCIIAVSKL